ncbi:MAG: hypothetical protein JXQ87_18015 [Bacteroidia bacterium]
MTRLKLALDKICHINTWNTDLEDCDNILRIESNQNISENVIKALHKLNIECIELY